MSDYTAEIAALRKAIASGAKSVSYDGKSVTYDDFVSMKQRLQLIEGWQTGARRPCAGFASFSRGSR